MFEGFAQKISSDRMAAMDLALKDGHSIDEFKSYRAQVPGASLRRIANKVLKALSNTLGKLLGGATYAGHRKSYKFKEMGYKIALGQKILRQAPAKEAASQAMALRQADKMPASVAKSIAHAQAYASLPPKPDRSKLSFATRKDLMESALKNRVPSEEQQKMLENSRERSRLLEFLTAPQGDVLSNGPASVTAEAEAAPAAAKQATAFEQGMNVAGTTAKTAAMGTVMILAVLGASCAAEVAKGGVSFVASLVY